MAPPLAAPDVGPGAEDLRAAFDTFVNALKNGDLDGFYAAIDGDAVLMDEDIPFRLSKPDFVDHIGFHTRGTWESFAWEPRQLAFRVAGDSGVIAGYSTFRGKPVDAGFRARYMAFTQGWHRGSDGWRMVNWHQSPLNGHILEASPG
jgi:ketosteroid isomerase-like protein